MNLRFSIDNQEKINTDSEVSHILNLVDTDSSINLEYKVNTSSEIIEKIAKENNVTLNEDVNQMSGLNLDSSKNKAQNGAITSSNNLSVQNNASTSFKEDFKSYDDTEIRTENSEASIRINRGNLTEEIPKTSEDEDHDEMPEDVPKYQIKNIEKYIRTHGWGPIIYLFPIEEVDEEAEIDSSDEHDKILNTTCNTQIYTENVSSKGLSIAPLKIGAKIFLEDKIES